jgi:hypothetical protein
MGEERDRELREEWADHPQAAFLGAGADIFSMRAGKGPESPEERQAREGTPPEAEGPSLDELMAREKPPVVSDFTRGARKANEEGEEGEESEED